MPDDPNKADDFSLAGGSLEPHARATAVIKRSFPRDPTPAKMNRYKCLHPSVRLPARATAVIGPPLPRAESLAFRGGGFNRFTQVALRRSPGGPIMKSLRFARFHRGSTCRGNR